MQSLSACPFVTYAFEAVRAPVAAVFPYGKQDSGSMRMIFV
jgi:hypothetical protein